MTEPRWLSQPEQQSWLNFIAVVELLPGALDTQLGKDAGLTHYEYLVMAVLSESPERQLRMTDLATRTNATLPRLSRVVLGLERRAFIERTSHPDDRRAKIARLSDAGMRFLEQTAPGHVGKVRELVVDALTPEEFETLGALSGKLLAHLDPDERFGVAGKTRHLEEAGAIPVSRLSLGAPATRALEAASIRDLPELQGASRASLLTLHGVGPRAIRLLDEALAEHELLPLVD